MTGKTVCGRIVTNKALSAPRMRSMTGTAVAPGNRVMDNSPGKRLLLPPVAGITEHILRPAQQPLIAGHMGIMTDSTPGLGNRFMHNLTGKLCGIVTFKTGHIGCLRPVPGQQRNSNQKKHAENGISHHFAPPL